MSQLMRQTASSPEESHAKGSLQRWPDEHASSNGKVQPKTSSPMQTDSSVQSSSWEQGKRQRSDIRCKEVPSRRRRSSPHPPRGARHNRSRCHRRPVRRSRHPAGHRWGRSQRAGPVRKPPSPHPARSTCGPPGTCRGHTSHGRPQMPQARARIRSDVRTVARETPRAGPTDTPSNRLLGPRRQRRTLRTGACCPPRRARSGTSGQEARRRLERAERPLPRRSGS